MKETVGMEAQLKLVKRTLDMLKYVKSQSDIKNDKKPLKRLENKLVMAASLTKINALKDKEKEEKVETQKKE